VGCFAYSPVDGAAANAFADPVDEPIREERRGRLMQLQEQISAARLKAKVGSTMTVLVDAIDGRKLIARSSADAPEIDGTVIVNGAPAAAIGDLVDVRITRAGTHDLWARPM